MRGAVAAAILYTYIAVSSRTRRKMNIPDKHNRRTYITYLNRSSTHVCIIYRRVFLKPYGHVGGAGVAVVFSQQAVLTATRWSQ